MSYKKNHIKIQFQDINKKSHQNFVPVMTATGILIEDWIAMWCCDHDIPKPVHMVEDSIGRQTWQRVY